MDSEQKIEERKKWNAPFLRAFNYLLDVLILRKGELCARIGISGTFTITLNDEWDAPWTGTW